MAYKPILAPQEFHEWLQRRAERLTVERGERVSMAETLRELPAVVEANEVELAGHVTHVAADKRVP